MKYLQIFNKILKKTRPLTEEIINNDIGKKKLEESDETKECPKCAETIKFKAVICRFCKYDFETKEFIDSKKN